MFVMGDGWWWVGWSVSLYKCSVNNLINFSSFIYEIKMHIFKPYQEIRKTEKHIAQWIMSITVSAKGKPQYKDPD